MSNFKLFCVSLLIAAGTLLLVIYVNRPRQTGSSEPKLVRVSDDLYITSQLNQKGVSFLKTQGFSTLIDIRPDGEERNQPSSSEIAAASEQNDVKFYYIPVPHESIPDTAVAALSDVLSRQTTPAVLYCRTGRRAVRLIALVKASQVDGPSAGAIREMVGLAGFSAEDLEDDIARRISERNGTPPEKN